jgi:hypothetical protein
LNLQILIKKTMRQSHSGYFLDNDWSNDDLLFNVPNFYQINYGLNKLNKETITPYYDLLPLSF